MMVVKGFKGVLVFACIGQLLGFAINVDAAEFGYTPDGMNMWDSWFIEKEDKVHMFHLQTLAAGSKHTPREAEAVGHAVSEDLLHWTPLPPALPPLQSGGLDDIRPYTGSVVEHDGQYYMYYTMRGTDDGGYGQRTGLALSKDLINWKRYDKNPVIVPDPKYYISHDKPMANKTVDCRDLTVVRDEEKDRWVGFYAARMKNANAQCAAIAAVESKDLINWKHLPPAFAPSKYTNIEVPEIYHLNGKWYMSYLTCIGFGPRGIFSEPYMDHGTLYAWSDKLEGPYHEFKEDNVLIADTNGNAAGISCKAVKFKGKTHVFYTERFPDSPHVLSPPMEITTDKSGYLRLAYSGYTELLKGNQIVSPGKVPTITDLPIPTHQWPIHSGTWKLNNNVLTGQAKDGWQIAYLGVGADNIEIIADVKLDAVAAGIVYNTGTHGNMVVMLDSEEKAVLCTYTPVFPLLHIRHWDIKKGKSYNLRIIKRGRRFEVYVDNLLALGFFENYPPNQNAQIGIIVDRGRAKISNLSVYELENK
jgi:beta-fructofuranosidase